MNPEIAKRLSSFESNMQMFFGELASLKSLAEQNSEEDKSPLGNQIRKLEQSFQSFTEDYFQFTKELAKNMAAVENKLDDLEQYGRRNCLVVHRIPEVKDEDCRKTAIEIFRNKLGVDLPIEQIDRAHRLKRKSAATSAKTPRPIIVKFTSYASRFSVFSNKKKLKGSSFAITESLTNTRLGILKKANQDYGANNVWTLDGKIIILVNNVKHYVTSMESYKNVPIPSRNVTTRPHIARP